MITPRAKALVEALHDKWKHLEDAWEIAQRFLDEERDVMWERASVELKRAWSHYAAPGSVCESTGCEMCLQIKKHEAERALAHFER